MDEITTGIKADLAENSAQLLNDLKEIPFLTIGVIVIAAWLAIHISQRLLPWLARHAPSSWRLYLLGAMPLLRLGIIVIAVLGIIPLVFNVTLQNFLVIAGGASVAIGFAFKELVGGLIAGVVAVIERPYKPGDWIEVDGDYGEVKQVGLRTLTITTPADDLVTIPHEKIWSHNIANANSGASTLMCVVTFHLEPNHDAKAMRDMFSLVAKTSPYLDVTKPVTVVLDQTLHGTRYQIKGYPFDLRDQFQLKSDITIRAKAALAEAGGQEVIAAASV